MSKIQAELPKLSLRDVPDENSFSSVSSPIPGPLSPPLGPMNTDIGDLHDVPINDNADTLSASIIHSRSLEQVYIKLYLIQFMEFYACNDISHDMSFFMYIYIKMIHDCIEFAYRFQRIHQKFF